MATNSMTDTMNYQEIFIVISESQKKKKKSNFFLDLRMVLIEIEKK